MSPALLALLSLICAADPLRFERVVPAPPSEVWKAWTTVEGTSGFFAPAAKIELIEGGPYELYFTPTAPYGSRGNEGGTVVGFEEGKRLTFTWSFPPSIPALRGKATNQVTVTLAAAGGGTRVTLEHGPFEEGEEWAMGRAYFARAWEVVLKRLERRFRTGAPSLSWPYEVQSLKWLAGSWKKGDAKAGAEELWVASEGGLAGLYRETMDGKPGFYELSTLLQEGDEVVLSMRMFDRALKDGRKTQGAPLRYVLTESGFHKATFVGEGANKATLSYELVNPHRLRIRLDRADGAPVETFELHRFFL
jgi:uncharacterized protein YndB with AHSA1/START domain